MTWLEGLTQVLLSAATSTTTILVIAYLGRQSLSQYFARDLEHYRSHLNQELEAKKYEFTKDLERLKSELNAVLSERQARFSLLHQKRAQVVADLYGLISPAERSIKKMTALMRWGAGDPEENKKQGQAEREAAGKAYDALQDYFDRYRSFLDEQTAERCDELLTHMREAYNDYVWSQGAFGGQVDRKQWAEAWKKVTERVPPAKKALEKDLRRILGMVEEPTPSQSPPS